MGTPVFRDHGHHVKRAYTQNGVMTSAPPTQSKRLGLIIEDQSIKQYLSLLAVLYYIILSGCSSYYSKGSKVNME